MANTYLINIFFMIV